MAEKPWRKVVPDCVPKRPPRKQKHIKSAPGQQSLFDVDENGKPIVLVPKKP